MQCVLRHLNYRLVDLILNCRCCNAVPYNTKSITDKMVDRTLKRKKIIVLRRKQCLAVLTFPSYGRHVRFARIVSIAVARQNSSTLYFA